MWPEQQAIKLHPYTARGKIPNLEPSQRGYIGQLNMLGNLAQVMGYLVSFSPPNEKNSSFIFFGLD